MRYSLPLLLCLVVALLALPACAGPIVEQGVQAQPVEDFTFLQCLGATAARYCDYLVAQDNWGLGDLMTDLSPQRAREALMRSLWGGKDGPSGELEDVDELTDSECGSSRLPEGTVPDPGSGDEDYGVEYFGDEDESEDKAERERPTPLPQPAPQPAPEEQSSEAGGKKKSMCAIKKKRKERARYRPTKKRKRAFRKWFNTHWGPRFRDKSFDRVRPIATYALKSGEKIHFHMAGNGAWEGAKNGGYEGTPKEGEHYDNVCGGTKDNAETEGYKQVHWNHRDTLIFLDENRRVIMVFCPAPRGNGHWTQEQLDSGKPLADEDWMEDMDAISKLLRYIQRDGRSTKEWHQDRRGTGFRTMHYGAHCGLGNPAHMLKDRAGAKNYTITLRHFKQLKRLASWQDALLDYWFPLIRHHICKQLEKVHRASLSDPDCKEPIRPAYTGSAFSTANANCRKQVCTIGHRDKSNYPGMPCAITPMGNFDHTQGGHMVFPELKIFVEFPAGATCLLPSGAVIHGNLALGGPRNGKHQTRRSFTQYTYGRLMAWAAFGGPAGDISAADRAKVMEDNNEGPAAQYARFSVFEDLAKDRQLVREAENAERARRMADA